MLIRLFESNIWPGRWVGEILGDLDEYIRALELGCTERWYRHLGF